MSNTINIIFDNAPSAHKLGILKDLSECNSLLIIHLPRIIDQIHFSQLSLKDDPFFDKRLSIEPTSSNEYIKGEIYKFLTKKLKYSYFEKAKVIHSFIDFKRLVIVNYLQKIIKFYARELEFIPHYEPLRLNDFFVIPRLIKFSLSMFYQKIFLKTDSIYIFSFLNSFIYKLFFKNIYFYPYKHIENNNDIQENILQNKLINKNVLNIIYVGKLIDRKNPLLLVKALKEIKFKVNLSIFGEGYLSKDINKIKNSITNNNLKIYLNANMENKKVLELMKQNDLLVLPSKFDGFGFVVYEALRNGLYVIVSDQVGAKDIISRNGAIFSSGNYSELNNLLNLQFIKRFQMT